MKFRFLLLVVIAVAIGVIATLRTTVVKPPAERGTWIPVPPDR